MLRFTAVSRLYILLILLISPLLLGKLIVSKKSRRVPRSIIHDSISPSHKEFDLIFQTGEALSIPISPISPRQRNHFLSPKTRFLGLMIINTYLISLLISTILDSSVKSGISSPSLTKQQDPKVQKIRNEDQDQDQNLSLPANGYLTLKKSDKNIPKLEPSSWTTKSSPSWATELSSIIEGRFCLPGEDKKDNDDIIRRYTFGLRHSLIQSRTIGSIAKSTHYVLEGTATHEKINRFKDPCKILVLHSSVSAAARCSTGFGEVAIVNNENVEMPGLKDPEMDISLISNLCPILAFFTKPGWYSLKGQSVIYTPKVVFFHTNKRGADVLPSLSTIPGRTIVSRNVITCSYLTPEDEKILLGSDKKKKTEREAIVKQKIQLIFECAILNSVTDLIIPGLGFEFSFEAFEFVAEVFHYFLNGENGIYNTDFFSVAFCIPIRHANMEFTKVFFENYLDDPIETVPISIKEIEFRSKYGEPIEQLCHARFREFCWNFGKINDKKLLKRPWSKEKLMDALIPYLFGWYVDLLWLLWLENITTEIIHLYEAYDSVEAECFPKEKAKEIFNKLNESTLWNACLGQDMVKELKDEFAKICP